MKEEEYEYCRIPKSLAKKIADLKCPDNFVLDYIEESKKDIKSNFDFLGEEILIYRGEMAKARADFTKVKEDALAANYALWESFEAEKKSIWEKSKELQNALKPLTEELAKINKAIDSLNTYRMDELIKTIQTFSGLWGENKEMLEFLMKNYKKNEA